MRRGEKRRAAAVFADKSRHDVRVARQPIFDPLSKVQAYELLYRPGTGEGAGTSGAAATARVILAAVSDFGLDHLAGKADIHINLPAELISSPIDIPLPPDRVVLEVLEDVQADEAVVAGINTYRKRGFRVALDDFAWAPGQGDARLLEHVDIVKVDILAQPADTLEEMVAALRSREIKLIAEKVETREQFQRCRVMGFYGFQGFFLQRPETFQGLRTEGFKPATLQVLAALQSSDYSTEEVEKLVSRDVALVHRVLRTLNSAYYAFPSPVSSIRHGVNLLGRDNLLKLCAILSLAAFRDRPTWLLANTLIRARMCELLHDPVVGADSGTFFMTGLLSHLDALLGVSREESLQGLALAPAVRAAVLERAGPAGRALSAVEAWERGEWDAVAEAGFADAAKVRAAYLDAVAWSEETVKLTVE
ncbi:MAG: EAL domain-containing protein [Gammaproteobacteria bacterium]|nr:EAL domain-containing protein [Gammaproteobacteria bacterium]